MNTLYVFYNAVTIESTDTNSFKGFLIQARRADSEQDQDEQIGSFLTPEGGHVRQACMTNGVRLCIFIEYLSVIDS